jgi:hypothetical protein
MSNFSISIAHNLPQEEAIKRIKSGLEDLKKRYEDNISDMHEEWKGSICEFGLSISGFSGKGSIDVKESQIEISANLPFAAVLFKSRIETAVREQMKEMLDKEV